MNLANEGLEAKKKEDEVSARKRKAEDDANWEGTVAYHVSLAPVVIYPIYSRKGAACGQLADIREFKQEEKEDQGCYTRLNQIVDVLDIG